MHDGHGTYCTGKSVCLRRMRTEAAMEELFLFGQPFYFFHYLLLFFVVMNVIIAGLTIRFSKRMNLSWIEI
jgi:hypothetical protein